MTDLPEIKSIYTDGACSGNPGPGGWGTVIYFVDGTAHELGGHAAGTTNNRMEMQAAIAALQFLQQHTYHHLITLNTDSKYLIQGITQWLRGWKRKGWKTSAGKAVLNQDLWMELDELTQTLATSQNVDIDWHYVKGHAGIAGNERCDEIARAYSHQQPIRLKQISNTVLGEGETVMLSQDSASERLDLGCDRPSPTANNTNEQPRSNINRITHSSNDNLQRLSHTLNRLQMADTIAQQGYLITTQELADLINETTSELTQRGTQWTWRNWCIVQIGGAGIDKDFWQLERLGDFS